MTASKIEWTEESWNPVRGCSRVSPGCEHCYAERQAIRHAGVGDSYEGLVRLGKHGPVWTGKVITIPKKLAEPFGWKRPRKVFVNSMSDLFHEDVPFEFIGAVFGVCAATPSHIYQILTKRSKRLRLFFEWLATQPSGADGRNTWDGAFACAYAARSVLSERQHEIARFQGWPLPNVWLGVSCEDQARADERIPDLLAAYAAVRFVSYEPALGPVDFSPYLPPTAGTCGISGLPCRHSLAHDKAALDWIIVGGESGPGARPFDIRWAEAVIEQCQKTGVACFVKQLGNDPRRPDGVPYPTEDVKGGNMDEWPEALRVRQYPEARSWRV
jgi:protein gp37